MLSVLRERLASRFVIVVRYYVCAAAFFVLTALLAGFVTHHNVFSFHSRGLAYVRSLTFARSPVVLADGWA